MIQIRRANPDDATALVEILGWLPIRSRVITTSLNGESQVEKSRLQNPFWCTLVAFDPGSHEVQGVAVGYDSRYFENSSSSSASTPFAKLEDLAVRPEHEKKGIGTALVHAFEKWARSRSCAKVEISGGPKPAFYEKCGYKKQGPFFHFAKNL